MQVVTPETAQVSHAGSAVTIGAYDGLHLGHQWVIGSLREQAAARGLTLVVATFDRHPASVLRPDHAPKLLCTLEEKIALLAELGVEVTCVIPFDEERSTERPEDFVDEVLVEALSARLVVVGQDFRFGQDRSGDVALLEALGASRGFLVEGVGLSEVDGQKISSTRIRDLVAKGDVEGAAGLLGRSFSVRGTVVHGDGRGGPELGYPTANVEVDATMAQPGAGIYAGWVSLEGGAPLMAAISVGRRPTFYADAPPIIEAHLLDWEGDCYGQGAVVSFVSRLRDELRFESVDALITQMGADVEATRARLLA